MAAAGSGDRSAGFNEDVPTSLRLPNLSAVGAVNQAGDETSFTSYGDTVVVGSGFAAQAYSVSLQNTQKTIGLPVAILASASSIESFVNWRMAG